MNLPPRKFEIGDEVIDTFNNDKVCTITALCYDEKESEWYYSFDALGWYLVPENDLVKYEGK